MRRSRLGRSRASCDRECGMAPEPRPSRVTFAADSAGTDRRCGARGWPVLVDRRCRCSLGAGRRGRGAEARDRRGHRPLVDEGSADLRGDRGLPASSSATTPVAVLVQGDLRQLVLTEDLGQLLELESCLAGNAPGGRCSATAAARRRAREIAELRPERGRLRAGDLPQPGGDPDRASCSRSQIEAAPGPGAARRRGGRAEQARERGLSEAEQQQAARGRGPAGPRRLPEQLIQLARQYGQTGLPRLDDPNFVSRSSSTRGSAGGDPKARFAYLFPSPDAALISVRLRPDLTDAERAEAIELFREAVEPTRARFERSARRRDYVVSGVPVVVDGLADELHDADLHPARRRRWRVMAIALALVFSLAAAAAAAGARARRARRSPSGCSALLGGSLTMASIAVLPVLIGLAVDYAIQFQARFDEARETGLAPARRRVAPPPRGGPVIATACLATAAGLLRPAALADPDGARLRAAAGRRDR